MQNRIGIDLGGTKIELVVLDADGRERWRHRVPTPRFAASAAPTCAPERGGLCARERGDLP